MTSVAPPAPAAIRPRHLLLLATVALTVIGALAVLSAADGASTGSPFTYFAKAVGFGAVGLLLMAYLGRGGLGGLALAHRLSTVLLAVAVAGVIFVMIPTPITPSINGARQWIQLPGFSIQPSELLKPALVLHLALVLAREPWRVHSLRLMAPPLLTSGAVLMLVAKEDLGSAVVAAGTVAVVLFIAGTSGRVMGFLGGLTAVAIAGLTMIAPERIERMTVFLDPFADRFGAGFQITHGFLAIGSGGVTGRGIGTGLEKHIIPEPQTDFILPVIMEEVGLLGATLVIALFLAIVLLGLRIARGTSDPYERLVAAGLTAIILCQAALNLWAVFGIAPLTGVPLPLVSAGGSSQLIVLASIGLLLDIDRRSTMPTVPLVTPIPPPRAERRERVDEVAPPPEPAPGELRVIDRRPASAPERPTRPVRRPTTVRGEQARPPRPKSAHAPAPQQQPPLPRGVRVVEEVAGLQIHSDGTVRLPSGRIGRPKSPMALPDGRVLLPDGRVVSRERATLATSRHHPRG